MLSPAAAARWMRWRSPSLAGLCVGGAVAAAMLSPLFGLVLTVLVIGGPVWLGRQLQRETDEGAVSEHPGAVMIASMGLLACYFFFAWGLSFIVYGRSWRGDVSQIGAVLLIHSPIAWLCWRLGKGTWARGANAALIASLAMGLAIAFGVMLAPAFAAGAPPAPGPGAAAVARAPDLGGVVLPTLAWLTVGVPVGGLLWLAVLGFLQWGFPLETGRR